MDNFKNLVQEKGYRYQYFITNILEVNYDTLYRQMRNNTVPLRTVQKILKVLECDFNDLFLESKTKESNKTKEKSKVQDGNFAMI